ncbi:MAG: hypothetical protein J5737_05000 [Bacteroidales bacterium]|nr:hypothetical protein [Bacteroidales bacterium]
MKIIKLSIALLFSAALLSGCQGFSDLFSNGINVKLDSKVEMTPSNGLIKMSQKEVVAFDSDGTVQVIAFSDKSLNTSADLTSGKPVPVADGEATIKPECDFYPNSVERPEITVSLNNPSDKTVTENNATITVDGKKLDSVAVEASAKSSGQTILSKDNMSGDLLASLAQKPESLKLSGGQLQTKGAEVYTLDFWLKVPLVYKKGEVISIDRTFQELGLTNLEIGQLGKTFKVQATVTNTLPFVINSQAESGEKVKANLDTPIKAGTPGNPSTTDIVITVNCSEPVETISDAVIHLQFTAEEGAKITQDTKLTISYKNVNIK